MMKIVIPTILLATIMIVAGFAVIPVEKAASVHTTIQANQNTPFTVVDTRTTAVGATEVRDFTLDCVNDCTIVSIIVRSTGAGMTTANIACVRNMEVDAVELRADLACPANDIRATDIPATLIGDYDEVLETLFTGLTAPTPVDLVTSATESQATDALRIFAYMNGGIASTGAIGPNPAGTRDVVVEVDFSTQATSATTVTVTWSGFIVGTTEPTAANVADA